MNVLNLHGGMLEVIFIANAPIIQCVKCLMSDK